MLFRSFAPAIIVNSTSVYNVNENGKRFTIAHELCHILHDQTRARRITHVSGPWASPGIEKRANAFAAALLMPRELVLRQLRSLDRIDHAETSRLAKALHVNEPPLIEHLYNIDAIGDGDRERLRAALRAN